MTPTTIDLAIVHTLAYADVFSFPMTVAEIHHFLIGIAAPQADVRLALSQPSPWLAKYIQQHTEDGQTFYALWNARDHIFELRVQRLAASQALWPKAVGYGSWLGAIPFVRMVAMTGALSVHNASDANDDLDYMLVVQSGRVWLARLFAVAMVRAGRLWGVTLCPNYVLSTEAMAQTRRDLFVAHEVTQMIPLVGHDLYAEMRDLNAWATSYIPNAAQPFFTTTDDKPRGLIALAKRTVEWMLGGAIGDRLEAWEMNRKLRKLGVAEESSDEVELNAQQVKGHFMNYGQLTLQRYEERLVTLGLSPFAVESGAAAD